LLRDHVEKDKRELTIRPFYLFKTMSDNLTQEELSLLDNPETVYNILKQIQDGTYLQTFDHLTEKLVDLYLGTCLHYVSSQGPAKIPPVEPLGAFVLPAVCNEYFLLPAGKHFMFFYEAVTKK
jgi:hypothetical protein